MMMALALAFFLQTPSAPQAPQASQGAKVYEDHCAMCHAAQNDPRTPPVSLLRQKSAAEILAALTSGSGWMPPPW